MNVLIVILVHVCSVFTFQREAVDTVIHPHLMKKYCDSCNGNAYI